MAEDNTVGDETTSGGARTRRRAALAIATAVLFSSVSVGWSAADVAAAPDTGKLVALRPERLADTRRADCGCRWIGDTTFEVDVAAHRSVPDDAIAAAITITAVATPVAGHVTVWPSGSPRPEVSTLNTRPDRAVANSTIVPLGDDGRITLSSLRPGGVVVDVTAVFVPASSATDGRFVPMNGRRVVDTRLGTPRGALGRGDSLAVGLPTGVPSDATAVVANVTSVRERGQGHLTVRPAGSPPVDASFLNADGSGRAVAASVIVPVSPDGFVIDSFAGGHLVVDVVGWFTGPSAAASTDGLFVPVSPRRLTDTRLTPGRIHAGGSIEVASPAPEAAAVVTNVTVVRPDRRGHVTAHPARTPTPGTSTVNPSSWNHTVANFAITRASTAGLAYRSHAGTDLVVDATGWFTGGPTAASTGAAPNTPTRSRLLVVGDSTLGGVALVPSSTAAFVGVDAVVDAAACRRLVRPSCRSDITNVIPNTAVEAIGGAAGRFDIVVIKTGYNDWFSDFPAEFHAVVAAARSKGAHTILWLTYNEDVDRPTARQAYAENNVDLRILTALPQYDDVVLADWLSYSRSRQDWFWDGTHLTPDGAWALTDYVSRWAAALEHRPCPRGWSVGEVPPDPCPPPERRGPVADPRGLY